MIIMIDRTKFLAVLLTCFSLGAINSACAEQINTKETQKTVSNKMHGKVTEILNVTGYTYAEVDTGKKKVWAAGPTTPLKIGDMISFSSNMPMENFHSKSMKRDFSIIYFIGQFNTDKETPETKLTSTVSAHDQIKQKQINKPVEGINKLKDGKTIAEIITHKHNLNGKSVRLRGQVTKFTANIMGKNWLHVRDSSTPDDLTITTDGTATIGDIIIIEGTVIEDKDYGFGYFYPVILENAKITKE